MASDHPRKNGAPNLADCATTNLGAAEAFYSAVSGRTPAHKIDSTCAIYSVQHLDGKRVAALNQLMQESFDLGIPPHWTTYFGVVDLDDALAKVTAKGGTLLDGLIDEADLEVGSRMAVMADPFGANFEIMQSAE